MSREPDDRRVVPLHPQDHDGLPHVVELWDGGGTGVEQVLARAGSAALAAAIFSVARRDYPRRRITLRHAARIVRDSATRP
jgi:hypothetical protein